MSRKEILGNLLSQGSIVLGASQYAGHTMQPGRFQILVEFSPIAFSPYAENVNKAVGIYTLEVYGEQDPVIRQGMINYDLIELLQFGEGLQEIAAGAFGSDTNCKKVYLPKSIQTIGEAAFYQFANSVELFVIEKGTSINLGNACFGNADGAKIIVNREQITMGFSIIDAISIEEANAEVYFPANAVITGQNNSLQGCTLHYAGNAQGAPWGATEWIRE